MSCVRSSNDGSSVGFLWDYRRMNVSITWAKNFLWVVGNADTLNADANWWAFIWHCTENDWIVTYNSNESLDQVPNLVVKSEKVYALEEGQIWGSPPISYDEKKWEVKAHRK